MAVGGRVYYKPALLLRIRQFINLICTIDKLNHFNGFPGFQSIEIIASNIHTRVYDKSSEFGFPVLNFPWLEWPS